jgi:N-acyl-D-amino-acid deacylase
LQNATCDILVKNAVIIDGTGNPFYKADIAINNGKIAKIKRNIETPAHRVIDASDLVVSPGFIDVHSHDDLYLLLQPNAKAKLLQGVTTTVIGNCGISIAPMCDTHRSELQDLLKFIGAEHSGPSDLSGHTISEFLLKIEKVEPAINVATLVGHSTIRIACMGSADRHPNELELARMQLLAAEAMQQGAFGISSGLIYAPGSYAKTDELVALAKAISNYAGIYTSHIRSESDDVERAVTEAISIGESAGIQTHISHHKTAGRSNWGRSCKTLKLMIEARQRGLEVTCDQYPYPASCTFLASVLPPSALAGGPEVFKSRLNNLEIRKEIISKIESESGGWENLLKGTSSEGVIVASSLLRPEYVGRSIAEIATAEGRTSYDVIFDLVVLEGRGTTAIFYSMSEEDVQRIMRFPLTMIGSDGIPGFGSAKFHPRFTGTFPRVLGNYVRQKGIISLEDAIRKMTSLPAQTFKFFNKGLVKEGFDADLAIFDPATVIDQATFETPGLPPKGICFVVVNGLLSVDEGELTDHRAGRVLRRN